MTFAVPGPLRRLLDVWAGLEIRLAAPAVGWLLLTALAWVYTYAYAQHPLNPGMAPATLRQGWWSWADQYAYWESAAELAQFQLTAEHTHYPLGYPFLGALSWRWAPTHAFFWANLLLVLAAAVAWWRLARCWLDRRLTLVTALAFIGLHREVLALTQVVPWNTIATQAALLGGLWAIVGTRGRRTVVWLTVLAGLSYLVRPSDAACFAPLLVWAVWRLPTWRQRFLTGLVGMTVIVCVVVAVAAVNHAVFGTRDTPYERMTWQAIGFGAYPILHKVYGLFVDGRTFFGETDTALLFRYPWFFLAIPGAVIWVRRQGGASIAVLATLLLNWVLYVNYNDFLPSAVYRFSLIHYLTWAFPVLFALAVLAVSQAWRERSGRIAGCVALGLAVVATGVQLEPRVLPVSAAPGRVDALPAVRPLWVNFPGESLDKVRLLRLDGRHLQEARDYQIPYVPSDLHLMLSRRAGGETLAGLPESNLRAVPTVGDFVWRWRLDLSRWRIAASHGG